MTVVQPFTTPEGTFIVTYGLTAGPKRISDRLVFKKSHYPRDTWLLVRIDAGPGRADETLRYMRRRYIEHRQRVRPRDRIMALDLWDGVLETALHYALTEHKHLGKPWV